MNISHVPAPQAQFVARALPVLKADERFVGVGVGGSWIAPGMDEFSDLDLVLACEPAARSAVTESRLSIAGSLGKLLSGFTGEHVGEPRLLICLYDAPLVHVDLKFISIDELEHRAEDPLILWERDGALTRVMARKPAQFPLPDQQWIEDRFWVWIHYAATKLGRGELFEVLDFLAFLRGQVLAPLAAILHSHTPRGMRRLESLLPEYVPAFDGTLAQRNRPSCTDALFATVQLYRELRDALDNRSLIRRSEAEEAAVMYLSMIAKRG